MLGVAESAPPPLAALADAARWPPAEERAGGRVITTPQRTHRSLGAVWRRRCQEGRALHAWRRTSAQENTVALYGVQYLGRAEQGRADEAARACLVGRGSVTRPAAVRQPRPGISPSHSVVRPVHAVWCVLYEGRYGLSWYSTWYALGLGTATVGEAGV